jgi:hypothetical protein
MNKRVACFMNYLVSVSTRAHAVLIIKMFVCFPSQFVQTKYASFSPALSSLPYVINFYFTRHYITCVFYPALSVTTYQSHTLLPPKLAVCNTSSERIAPEIVSCSRCRMAHNVMCASEKLLSAKNIFIPQ